MLNLKLNLFVFPVILVMLFCCSRTEQLVQDIDPEVVRAALRDFLQELKDTQREKDDAKIEVSNLTRQVNM